MGWVPEIRHRLNGCPSCLKPFIMDAVAADPSNHQKHQERVGSEVTQLDYHYSMCGRLFRSANVNVTFEKMYILVMVMISDD